MRRLMLLTTAVLALVALAAAPASAGQPYAPVGRPGPRLSVPAADLAKSVRCTPAAYGSHRPVALFVPPTGIGPEGFAWNWFAALDRAGYPYCAVTPPGASVGDVQVSAEYVVHAIRHTRAISRARIAVIGHSQGGVSARFALRFWPDTRAMVADYVALGTPNHGSAQNDALYPAGEGPAFGLQLKTTSRFIEALNSRQETFAGISYTSLSTAYDQFVTPAGSTDLAGPTGRVANISLQDVCPGNRSDHIAIGTSDPVAYALTMRAITGPGPADPRAIPAGVCDRTLMPGVDPAGYEAELAAYWQEINANLAGAAIVATEPPLRPYVHARP